MAPETFVQLARTLRTHAPPPRARPAAADPFDALRTAMDPDVIALVTHELRSPVTAILGYAELLADGVYGEVDQRARAGLGRVSSAARQLRGLIDGIDLLLGNGTPDIEPVDDVDIGAVVIDLIDAARPEATMRGLKIETSIGPLVPLRTDPDALARALRLLLDASMRSADGTLHVRVTAGDPGVIIAFPPPVETDARNGAHLRLAMAGRLLHALGGFLDTGSPDAVRAVVRAIDVPETNP
jgi:signal transduction histidine kinase